MASPRSAPPCRHSLGTSGAPSAPRSGPLGRWHTRSMRCTSCWGRPGFSSKRGCNGSLCSLFLLLFFFCIVGIVGHFDPLFNENFWCFTPRILRSSPAKLRFNSTLAGASFFENKCWLLNPLKVPFGSRKSLSRKLLKSHFLTPLSVIGENYPQHNLKFHFRLGVFFY